MYTEQLMLALHFVAAMALSSVTHIICIVCTLFRTMGTIVYHIDATLTVNQQKKTNALSFL